MAFHEPSGKGTLTPPPKGRMFWNKAPTAGWACAVVALSASQQPNAIVAMAWVHLFNKRDGVNVMVNLWRC
jgi:hypothetical protein